MPIKNKPLIIEPALALLEYNSIAAGIQCGDAMVKRSVLSIIHAGTVQPGRFLILIGGEVAEVEEALKAGLEVAPDTVRDHVFLPGVHQDVVRALSGGRKPVIQESLGILETSSVPSAILVADAGIKGAEVDLIEVRLADGLDGKGIVLFSGKVSNIEAALELAGAKLKPGQLIRSVVIPQIHEDMTDLLQMNIRFASHMGWDHA